MIVVGLNAIFAVKDLVTGNIVFKASTKSACEQWIKRMNGG